MNSIFKNLYGLCAIRKLQVFKKDLQIGLLTKVTNPERLVFGNSIRIGFNCWLNMADGYPGTIVLNDEVSIGARAFITCAVGISIGSGTVISTDVFITDHDHDFYNPSSSIRFSELKLSNGTNIGENCFIGTKSCILPGVQIGDNSIIGAGSVVTKDIPCNSLAFGNPARVYRTIEIGLEPRGPRNSASNI